MSNQEQGILDINQSTISAASRVTRMPRLFTFILRYILNPLVILNCPSWALHLRGPVMRLGGGYLPPRALTALGTAVRGTEESSRNLIQSFREKKPVVWVDWMVPVAIVRAFGYEVWCPSAPFSISAGKGPEGGAEYVAYAEERGISEDLCSVNKSSLGCFFKEEMPPPALCINGSHPCDSARMMNMIIDYYTPQVPSFTMNTPYGRSEEELEKWEQSAWDLIAFLEKESGRPLDWEKLEKYGRRIDRFDRAMNETAQLMRSLPAPPLVTLMTGLWRWRLSDAGSEGLTRGAEILRDAAAEYVERHARRGTPREKIRVIFGDQSATWTDFGPWLKKKFDAVIVMDYMSRSCYPPIDFSSREALVRSLAVEELYLSMIRQSHGTMELNVAETASMIEEYQADCVIFYNHAGCKHNQALQKILADTCREAGVPALFLDLDIVDNRYLGEDALYDKIESFFRNHGLI